MRLARPLAPSLLACLLLAALPARATTVVKLSAGQVDALADRIVEARCVGQSEAEVPGLALPVVATTFVVERVVKGDELARRVAAGDTKLVVRQLAARGSDGRGGVPGMPSYAVGAKYRLALNGDSPLGLTSPVGLGQGVRVLEPAPSATQAATP